MSNWVGKMLGKVQIESLVGRGGVAEVYLGTHTTLERKVAVKILRNLNEESSDALVRFQREARVIAKLRHPNIVQVHDFDTVENDPYLVMEYIEGPSLSRYLNTLHEQDQRLPFAQVIRLLNAIASALQYAHNNGLVHRDIKPGNILLTSPSRPIEVGNPLPDDFEPVLTDFGLVRFLDGNRQTTTGLIAGTPAYMSPEQARGEATDGKTDVYSLGIVLYEILAGHVPFDGETTVSILLKQVNDPPPPIPGLSPSIQNVLNRVLAKDVKDRFQTPLDFANAFRAAVEMKLDPSTVQMDSLPLEASTLQMDQLVVPQVDQTLEETPKPQPRWLPAAVLTIAILALGGLIFLNGRPSSLPEPLTPTAASATDTVVPATSTAASTQTAAVLTGPPGILHFQNGSAVADQAFLTTRAMPAPPPGTQYEIWLTHPDDRLSLGIFSPDEKGQGELTFSDPDGLSLITRYDGMEITIEPNPDTDPEPSGLVAYSFTLPQEGLTHMRYLLSTFPSTPGKRALIQGAYTDIKQIADLVEEMQIAFEDDDKVSALEQAEDALNLLVGAKSPDFKDWNEDGQTLPKSDSYGLLVNGSSFGYLQASYVEADFTVNTPGATQYMIENGESVQTCTQNLIQWTTQLRDLLITILTSTADSEVSAAMRDGATLVDQMLNGIDLDNNGTVDSAPGECGAETAYEYAYHMVDMPILPASVSYQLTIVADYTPVAATQKPDSSQNNSAITPRPRNTKRPNPVKTDKPPKNNNKQ